MSMLVSVLIHLSVKKFKMEPPLKLSDFMCCPVTSYLCKKLSLIQKKPHPQPNREPDVVCLT